jgi:hypothetical protein
MALAQLKWRVKLRDIGARLGANSNELYSMGMRHAVRRSTLADTNETRNWGIGSDLAALLVRRVRRLSEGRPTCIEPDNRSWTLSISTVNPRRLRATAVMAK